MTDIKKVSCFQCSELQAESACPSGSVDYTVWQNVEGKFTSTNDEYCSIVVGKSGKIYHQGSLDSQSCRTGTFLSGISLKIAGKFKESESNLKCCNNNGCNWSLNTAKNNGNIDLGFTTTDLYGSTWIYYAIGLSVLGFFVLLFCLCVSFLLYKRCQDDNAKNERKTLGVQAANLKGAYSQKFNDMDQASNKSVKGNFNGPNRIAVKEASSLVDPWHEKWERHTADKRRAYDQYNINGYRRDGKLNSELKAHKNSRHRKPTDYNQEFNLQYHQRDEPKADVLVIPQQPDHHNISTGTTESSAWGRDYNGVDMDWIDIKSNDHFSGLDKDVEKAMKKKPSRKSAASFRSTPRRDHLRQRSRDRSRSMSTDDLSSGFNKPDPSGAKNQVKSRRSSRNNTPIYPLSASRLAHDTGTPRRPQSDPGLAYDKPFQILPKTAGQRGQPGPRTQGRKQYDPQRFWVDNFPPETTKKKKRKKRKNGERPPWRNIFPPQGETQIVYGGTNPFEFN